MKKPNQLKKLSVILVTGLLFSCTTPPLHVIPTPLQDSGKPPPTQSNFEVSLAKKEFVIKISGASHHSDDRNYKFFKMSDDTVLKFIKKNTEVNPLLFPLQVVGFISPVQEFKFELLKVGKSTVTFIPEGFSGNESSDKDKQLFTEVEVNVLK